MSHRIAAIAFRPGTLRCSCGVAIVEPDPAELADAFRLHRADHGLRGKLSDHALGPTTGRVGFSLTRRES